MNSAALVNWINRSVFVGALLVCVGASAASSTTDTFGFAQYDWYVFDWTPYPQPPGTYHYVPRTPDDVTHSSTEVDILSPDQYIFRGIKTAQNFQESAVTVMVEMWETQSFNFQSFPFDIVLPFVSFGYFNWDKNWYLGTWDQHGNSNPNKTFFTGIPALNTHYFAKFDYNPATHTVVVSFKQAGGVYSQVYSGPAYWGANNFYSLGESGRFAKISLLSSDGTGTAHYGLTCTGCLGGTDLSGGVTNPLFSGTPGNCPANWTCSGSPAPGFASYNPTTAQYPGGSPFATSAFSPTVYGGSGVIRQLTSLTWVGGSTYLLDLWAGLPATEPDGRSPVAGWPQAPNGAARLYLTMGDGFGQVAAFDIPSPAPGTFTLNPISFTLPVNSGAVGQKIGVMIFVSAPSWFSANFAITPVGGPAN
jgi:hypothetical protein